MEVLSSWVISELFQHFSLPRVYFLQFWLFTYSKINPKHRWPIPPFLELLFSGTIEIGFACYPASLKRFTDQFFNILSHSQVAVDLSMRLVRHWGSCGRGLGG